MEFVDWKMILTLIMLGINTIVLVAIKFNDLWHLDKAVKKIDTKVDKIDEKLNKTNERVSKLEGKID